MFFFENALAKSIILVSSGMTENSQNFVDKRKGESERLQSQLDLIGMVCGNLGSGVHFSEQLRFLSSKVCEILEVDVCIVRSYHGGFLDLIYSSGVKEGLLIQRLGTDKGIAEILLSTRKPVIIEDASVHPLTQELHNKAKVDPGHFTFCSFAGVPMIAHEQVVGVIGVYTSKELKRFTESELNLLQILANSAGLAMRNDQLISRIAVAETSVKLKIVELLEDSERVNSATQEHDGAELYRSKSIQIESDISQDTLDLRIFYQPLRQPWGAQPLGFEALLRWDHPRYGILQPSSFIPLAEAKGLINKLGLQIYAIVAREFASLSKVALPNHFVALNLSIWEISAPGIPEILYEIFTKFDVEPRRVILELTERSPLEPRSPAIRNLFLLSEMGFRIFLDDFGTGHTSLSYLLDYSFNGIKIDKIFMPTSRDDNRRIRVIENLNNLAHDLGLLVVAEGIETPEQEELCLELNFDLLQGFGIGRPEPVLMG